MSATTYTPILTRGTKANLPETVSDGKVRLTTDSQQLFFEVGSSRIEITDFVKGYNTTQILNISSPLDKIYLASDTKNLWYYNTTETEWENISIMHTHTASQISGLGSLATLNYITAANIDTTTGLDFGDEDA